MDSMRIDQGIMRVAGVLTLCLLAACSNTSHVMKLGPDTYQVEGSAHNFYGGGSPEARGNAYAAAERQCASLGKEIIVKNIASTFERPFYRTTLTFQCLSKGDPDLVRPVYEKEADIVIKQR